MAGLREDGFVRAIIDGRLVISRKGERGEGRGERVAQWSVASGQWSEKVASGQWPAVSAQQQEDVAVGATNDNTNPQSLIPNPPSPPSPLPSPRIYAVVDRLAAGSASESRLRDSLETALAKGHGQCYAFVEIDAGTETTVRAKEPNPQSVIPNPSPCAASASARSCGAAIVASITRCPMVWLH